MKISFAALKDEYTNLFSSCKVNPDKIGEINQLLATIQANRGRYERVAAACSVPWYVISLIHCLEANLNFACHLHNGDPLYARTVNVPSGRPPGNPPFSWEASAEDALCLDGLNNWPWAAAGTPGILYQLELYNGWGYRLYHPTTLSPYLWSGTNHYSSGKYVADGRWDSDAVSDQIGAAAILRVMVDRGIASSTDRWLQLIDPPMHGDDVGKLQLALRAHGIQLDRADKVFGPSTHLALEEFQQKKGLTVDGIAGPLTRKALGL